MGTRSWYSALVALGLACADGTASEPEPICVSIRKLELDPCSITRSGALLVQTPEGLLVRQLHDDGTLTDLAILDVAETCSGGAQLEHDPATGRMWLVVQGDYTQATPARLWQFDATGQVEWERPFTHEGRYSRHGSVVHDDGALFVNASLEPLVPFDPSDPDDWPESNAMLVERLDLAGERVWARLGYPLPDDPDVDFVGAGAFAMTTAGLAMIASPPLIDYGPVYPLVISPDDGAVIWSGDEGHEHLSGASDGELVFLGWTHRARLDHVNIGDGPPLRELEPARSMLDVRSPTGERLGYDEVEWPGWVEIESTPAMLGEQVATFISAQSDGRSGITVHAKDGTLACKGTLELDGGAMNWALGIEGREQVVVSFEHEHGPVLLLLGPPPAQQ